MNTYDELKGMISERLEAIEGSVSEERVTQIVQTCFSNLTNDEEFVRKMRFARPDPELVGTKFARWGLSVGDVEWLYDLQSSLKGQRRVIDSGIYEGPSETLETTFRTLSEAVYLSDDEIKAIDGKAIDKVFPRIPKSSMPRYLPSQLQDRDNYLDHVMGQRAMDTAESGFGAELVGTQYVGELWTGARRESRVFGLIPTFEMTDLTAELPVEADIPEMLFVGESTTSSTTNYATSKTGSNKVTVTAKKFLIHQVWSGEMEEDSIIPFIPFLRRQTQVSISHYSDSLVLNGDTTNAATGNINLDDADPADTKHYLAFDGIRHAALVDNTANDNNVGGAITLNVLRDLKSLMLDTTYLHDWGHPTDAMDLIYVADPETADRIAMFDDVINAVQRLGPNAQLLSGEVGRALGHPVISSIAMSKTEADGKVSTTGSNNILGQVVAFNRRGLNWGWRRRVRVETERLPATDQTRIVSSLRAGLGRFTPTGAASGIEWATVARNITL